MDDGVRRVLLSIHLGTVLSGSGYIRTKKDPKSNEDTMGDWALVDVHAERETSPRHVSQLQFFLATPLLPLQLSPTLSSLPCFSLNHLTTRIRSPHMGINQTNHPGQIYKSSIFMPVTHTTVGHCTKQDGKPNTQKERIQECGVPTLHRKFAVMAG